MIIGAGGRGSGRWEVTDSRGRDGAPCQVRREAGDSSTGFYSGCCRSLTYRSPHRQSVGGGDPGRRGVRCHLRLVWSRQRNAGGWRAPIRRTMVPCTFQQLNRLRCLTLGSVVYA